MWDRYDDPKEMSRFMHHMAREMDGMRRDMAEVLRECREAQFVRMRMERDYPGYWEDSVRLGKVKKQFREAL